MIFILGAGICVGIYQVLHNAYNLMSDSKESRCAIRKYFGRVFQDTFLYTYFLII